MESEVRPLNLRTGITVPCLLQGEPTAKPLLLLHAWGESRRSFDRLIPLLALAGAPLTLNRRPVFADEVEALTEPIDEDWVRQALLWFQLGTPVPQWYLDDRVRDAVRMPVHVWKSALAGLYQATPPLDMGVISAPALILRGEQDDLLPRADPDYWPPASGAR